MTDLFEECFIPQFLDLRVERLNIFYSRQIVATPSVQRRFQALEAGVAPIEANSRAAFFRAFLPLSFFGSRIKRLLSPISASLGRLTKFAHDCSASDGEPSARCGKRATAFRPDYASPRNRMEEVLSSHPAVAECAVIGVKDELKGEVPCGFVVLKAGVDREPAEVERELVTLVRDKIGPVAAFKIAIVVNRLPKTRSGKILRGTMKKIADAEAWTMPAAIEDPATRKNQTIGRNFPTTWLSRSVI